MLTRNLINDALRQLRASTRPKGESQADFARRARLTDNQVAQVMRGGILQVPAMEGWVKACGFELSQFIANLEMEARIGETVEVGTGPGPPANNSHHARKPTVERRVSAGKR